MSTPLPSHQALLSGLRPISVANLPGSSTIKPTCIICFNNLADYGASERAVRLQCTHVFGERCIRNWLEENDTCPTCRAKVYAGRSENHQRQLLNSLVAQMGLLMQHTPTPESPIIDLDVLKLFTRLAGGRVAITSEPLRAELKIKMSLLLQWREQFWAHNPLCLRLPEFAPYTRTETLRLEDFDVQIEVHEDQFFRHFALAAYAEFMRGLAWSLRGLPLHVAGHPLATGMESAIRAQIRQDRGHTVTVSSLLIRLRHKLESGRTRGVMTGEREDLPRGFQPFWEDVLVRVMRGLIDQQRAH